MRGCVQKFEHRSEERIVNRNLLYISTIILTLAGCASEDYIGDPETRIQNEMLGRALVDGVESVKLFGETIDVNAHILTLAGISGHADKNGLTDWVCAFENLPQRVFLVHGEDETIKSFCKYLHEECGQTTYAPYSGTVFDMVADEFIYEAEPVAVKKKEGSKRVSEVFARLLAAGNRLLTVIAHNEGGTNKDLAKFADQINSLCDKWDR